MATIDTDLDGLISRALWHDEMNLAKRLALEVLAEVGVTGEPAHVLMALVAQQIVDRRGHFTFA